MTHLRDTEFVDFAEGTLAAARAAHLDACAECRAQAEAVSAALREVTAVEMPEPSPLFWEHFSARVRDEVAHEVPDQAPSWAMTGIRALMPLVAAVALVIAVLSATLLPRWMQSTRPGAGLVSSHASADAGGVVTPPVTGGDLDPTTAVDPQNAGVWDMLTAAASDMGADDAHAAGMGVRPGAVDHAVTHMNQAELTELGRLLKDELKRSSD
jgi:hypothetical protein